MTMDAQVCPICGLMLEGLIPYAHNTCSQECARVAVRCRAEYAIGAAIARLRYSVPTAVDEALDKFGATEGYAPGCGPLPPRESL